MYYISFPGLGIEPFHIDRMVTIPGLNIEIAWYGILITCGMILAMLWGIYMGKFEGVSSDDIIDLAFVAIVCGVIGARLYYVIFTWNEFNYVVTGGTFFKNLWGTLYNIIAIWNGGLGIYGGVIFGALGAIGYAKLKRKPPLKIFDILAPSVLIGQIIGRWGNFINIEAFGGETTLPWRMGIHYSFNGALPESGAWAYEKFVHPTFLYESLWNLVALIFIMLTFKKKKFNGQVLCIYMIWYGFGRMLIEGLRTDSLMLGPIRISQLVGLLSCVAGVILFIFLLKQSQKTEKIIETAKAHTCENQDEDGKNEDNDSCVSLNTDKGEETEAEIKNNEEIPGETEKIEGEK